MSDELLHQIFIGILIGFASIGFAFIVGRLLGL
jgi:hypothetical protein